MPTVPPIPDDAIVFAAHGRTVAIIYRRFPEKHRKETRGFVVKEDGRYTVIINTDLSPLLRNHTLGHELAHVFCGHLDTEGGDKIEQEHEADRLAWDYYKAYRDGCLDCTIN